MLLHEERAGPRLVPSKRTLHYRTRVYSLTHVPLRYVMCAVLSRATISQAQVCGAVLSRSTGHSLEEWVGVDAAGSVKRLVTRPDHQGGRRRV